MAESYAQRVNRMLDVGYALYKQMNDIEEKVSSGYTSIVKYRKGRSIEFVLVNPKTGQFLRCTSSQHRKALGKLLELCLNDFAGLASYLRFFWGVYKRPLGERADPLQWVQQSWDEIPLVDHIASVGLMGVCDWGTLTVAA